VGDTEVQRLARRRSVELRRSIGNAIRRMRMDAGLSMAAVSVAAGIHPSYLRLIEAGERDAGDRVLAAIGFVLGADVSVRLFPNTGPRIHDRFQALMVECLIGALHHRWQPTPEVVVTKPARGVIDLVLGERQPSTLIASEFNSQLRRLEQQLRWHREKEQSLPSSELWRFAAVDGDPIPPACSRCATRPIYVRSPAHTQRPCEQRTPRRHRRRSTPSPGRRSGRVPPSSGSTSTEATFASSTDHPVACVWDGESPQR
jgi:transcriptional regulator with XRE-family HTH domain